MARPFHDMVPGWGVAKMTAEVVRHVDELRSGAERLRQRSGALSPQETDALLWRMVADGVPEALAWQGSAPLPELCERACALRGREGGYERLVMRERARVMLHTLTPHEPVREPSDLLDLWDEATCAEPAVRLWVDEPRWRQPSDGRPFTGMGTAWLRGVQPLSPGRETAEPEDIPMLVAHMLGFLASSDLPPEALAAHVPHLVGYIHPFSDGNGHTGRMLLSDLLVRAGYGLPVLVAYAGFHRERSDGFSQLMRATVLRNATAEDLVCLQLHTLVRAQERAIWEFHDEGAQGRIMA